METVIDGELAMPPELQPCRKVPEHPRKTTNTKTALDSDEGTNIGMQISPQQVSAADY